jgi:SAM-dependent methyltransferase
MRSRTSAYAIWRAGVKAPFPPRPEFAAMIPDVPPATARNAAPIAERLCALLPPLLAPGALVLEVASGVGHHAAVLAAALPQYRWQPSERDAAGCAGIAERVRAERRGNLLEPLILDVMQRPWPTANVGAVICINMIHISPWDATAALFAGAAAASGPDGLVITYGPYRIDGDWGADSNRAFDESLRMRNPTWGVREYRDIVAVAAANGFAPLGQWPMPANNHLLAFRNGVADSA